MGGSNSETNVGKKNHQECDENVQTWAAWLNRKGKLMFFTVCLLLSSVGNQVNFKRMTSAMPNYGWYLTQLSTFIYVPFFLVLAGTGVIEGASRSMLKKFAIMGLFDGLSGTLMVLGGSHTGGTMQVLLSQCVIPMTIALSVVCLSKEYHWLQYLGAGVIVAGILAAQMLSTGGGADSNNLMLFNIIFVVSMIPTALSSVFKEIAFKDHDGDLDVNVLQFWVAIFQFLTNFIATPIYTLKILGPQQVPLSEMSNLLYEGTRCLFFLEDQVKDHCGLPGERECDHCTDAWVPVFSYLFFNMMFNVFTMLVIKHGSAALSFLVATLRMPLSSLAFSSTWIMGAEAVQPGLSDYVSLVVIITGLVVYRYGARLLKEQLRKRHAGPTYIGGVSPLTSPTSQASPASPGLYKSRSSNLLEPLQAKDRRPKKWQSTPLFSAFLRPTIEPDYVLIRRPMPKPRTAERVRNDLYARLAVASPLASPQLRHMTPSASGASPSPRFEDPETPSPVPHFVMEER